MNFILPRVAETSSSMINADTRYCAVYGHPIRHSASPAMHNAAMAALGLNWRYLAFDVHPVELRQAISGAQAMKFIGLNLTVPHKLLALELVDDLDESARMWGAINTIRFEARAPSGQWIALSALGDAEPKEIRARGYNTDADAIIRSLQEDLDLKIVRGASVLILGAGGAARVAALKLAAEGAATLFLVNRTTSKAVALAEEIRRRFPGQEVRTSYPTGTVDLTLNATSVGLEPEAGLPFDEAQFALRQSRSVYDMIYRPPVTPFLRAAKAAGCRTSNGLGMLLYQGAKALEIWSGLTAPIDVMRQALKRHIYE